jgi:hypothetical protein
MAEPWEVRALAAVTGRRKRGRRGRKPGYVVNPSVFDKPLVPTNTSYTPEFMRLLSLAAERRDVNRSTYIRRAVALVMSADLDLPIGDILYHSPAPGRWQALQRNPGGRDEAVGIDQWCPHPGCDGSHLRRSE